MNNYTVEQEAMDIFDNLPAFLSVYKSKHMPLLSCSSSLFVDLAQTQPREPFEDFFKCKLVPHI